MLYMSVVSIKKYIDDIHEKALSPVKIPLCIELSVIHINLSAKKGRHIMPVLSLYIFADTAIMPMNIKRAGDMYILMYFIIGVPLFTTVKYIETKNINESENILFPKIPHKSRIKAKRAFPLVSLFLSFDV